MSDFVFRESRDSFSGFRETSGNIEVFGEIAKGDKGDPGKDFQIQGVVDSVGDLPTAEEVGETWLVGTEAPYDGYLWDGTEWVNIGPVLQGPPGKDGKDGADYVLTAADKTEIAHLAEEEIETDLQPQIDDIKKKTLIQKTISISAASTSQQIGSASDMRVNVNTKLIRSEIAVPSYQTSDWTITTSDYTDSSTPNLTVSGTCSAATTMTLILGEVD